MKACNCEGDCDCITIKPGDEMSDPKSDKFVSKMNLLDDEKFEAAMKEIRKRKKLPPEENVNHGRKKSIEG